MNLDNIVLPPVQLDTLVLEGAEDGKQNTFYSQKHTLEGIFH